VARKIKPTRRVFFHATHIGEHWARVSVEWTEHPDTPENWKANAEAVAMKAFDAADLAHDIVSASNGKSVKV